MRNIFDQYDQPENKITHALMASIESDRDLLLKPFLNFMKIKPSQQLHSLHLDEQCVPGEMGLVDQDDEKESERRGLPDGCIYDKNGWAVLFEVKVQAPVVVDQLVRHRNTAKKYGYEDTDVIVISVDKPGCKLPLWARWVAWQEIYQWFCQYRLKSVWANRFVQYLEIFESKMIARDYEVRGTMTIFSGFHFNDDQPYTYFQGKRLIKLLRQRLLTNKKLVSALDLDMHSRGRAAITRNLDGGVWDIMTTNKAANEANHTGFPHATLDLDTVEVSPAITLPNALKGGIKTKLKTIGPEGFQNIVEQVHKNMMPLYKQMKGMRPIIYILQRRYKSQRSIARRDGCIEVDIRTVVKESGIASFKHQPMWTKAIYDILTNRTLNIQLGLRVFVPYTEKCMQSADAVDVLADIYIACKPLMDFGRGNTT
ncbi:hypothetical protein [Poriferisphaera sp. WC338]|uniref:hypothetical protein n=1 Tax=Poriferisphaera sp. WC338 TaxID=3425129 RepID=UPI003D8130A9